MASNGSKKKITCPSSVNPLTYKVTKMAAEESNLIYKSFNFLADNAGVIFSGVGVAALGFIYNVFKGKGEKVDKGNENKNTIMNLF
jgi:hypothetical protein